MKHQQKITFLLLFIIIILSCKSNNKNEPAIYNVGENDPEMNKVIEMAKQSLDSFDYAFNHYTRVFTFFGLKKRFQENENVEHIWIGNIKFENGIYIGIIDNLPEKITSVKLGDTVKIDKKDISDWMYIKNAELYGGYTIRLLRNRMSESERQKFDAESGMKIK